MAASPTNTLCQICRNLNLRLGTFIDTGWRHPTSLEYETVEDVLSGNPEDRERHYVLGEYLNEDCDYSDKELEERLEAPRIVNEFDDAGLYVNVRPSKRKVVGYLADFKKRASRCTLCRLILAAVDHENNRRKLPSQSLPEEFFKDSDICKIKFEYCGQGGGHYIPELMQLDKSLAHGRYDCSVSIGEHFEAYIYPLITDSSLKWFGGRLYQPQIDFGMVQSWLQSCERFHERCGTERVQRFLRPISRLRFIDVHDMCLVDGSENSHYLTLSYVWGIVPVFQTEKRFKDALYIKGGLQKFWDRISKTVQDAIQVVRKLDERFLWTDSICIVQDDVDEKSDLIRDMNTVYARAKLTIVAAEGRDANAGLAGLHQNSRSVPELFSIWPDLSLFLAQAPLWEVLLRCPWSTRAWTYQEALLSPRLLIFTDSTVHFACCSTCWSEDINSTSEELPPPWKYASGAAFTFRPGMAEAELLLKSAENAEDSDILPDLWGTVASQLSERHLSFETDILFAAAGMLDLLEKFFRVKSVFGLPERRIQQFLFWSPMEPGSLRRRLSPDKQPFNPSWSWSGWVGEVAWLEEISQPVKSSAQQQIDWMGLAAYKETSVPFECNGRGTAEDDQMKVSTEQSPFYFSVAGDWPLLQFRSRVSRFSISKSATASQWIRELQPYAWDSIPALGREKEGVYCIISLNSPKVVVGSVVLDAVSSIAGVDEMEATFVIISSDPHTVGIEGFTNQIFYKVLAIDWMGNVCERFGHGMVLQQSWDESNWQLKTVILA
jgi:Heterokaryon incompatibility protein (HET)